MKLAIIFSQIILCFIGLIACKKDKLPEAGGTTLERVIISGPSLGTGEYLYAYNYDQQNRLTSTNSKSSNGVQVVTGVFTYDAQGRLATHTVPLIFSYTFIYDANGRIVKKTGAPILANLQVDDYSYSYDAQNRVIADTQYYAQSNAILAYHTYSYDANGNITEANTFSKIGTGPFTNIGKATFTFDNKLNPYYNLRSILYYAEDNAFSLNRNNISNLTTGSIVSTFSYDYYSNDLPQYQTSNASNSTQKITSVFFFKQP